MRFAAVFPRPPEPRPSVAEVVRRLVGGEGKTEAQQEMKRTPEPPLDLDQRVRLVGEW